MELYFPKKSHVVTELYMIIYEKHIIFNIAFGEMHEYLAWEKKAPLNSFDNGFHG